MMPRPVPLARLNAVRPYVDAYAAALAGDPVHVRHADGRRELLDAARWLGPARHADLTLLDRITAPTLDVGCGPGRLVSALTSRGVPALGIDVDGTAVRITRQAGAIAVRRSVFRRLPGEGRWGHALLADGNIGIGGDPARLLRRCAELLAPTGVLHVELQGSGGVSSGALRLEAPLGHGPWFPWATVGVDGVEAVASAAAVRVSELWSVCEATGPRWFAVLTKC